MQDIEAEIELQEKNGVDLGVSLHSRQTAMAIAQHISIELRNQIFSKIIEQNSKICIVIDEASTVSKKSALVVILRCDILGSDEPINVFVDLKELDSTNAETISHILLLTLESYGFNDPYLKKNLIGFCSDGASTMLGCKSGVSVRLLSKYPGIIIWHCLSHRVQLALDDAIKSISQVDVYKRQAVDLSTNIEKFCLISRTA